MTLNAAFRAGWHIEHCLAKGADCTALSAPVYELADDLASVGSHKPLVKALRELAGALRYSPNPRPELAAARKAFAYAVVPPPPRAGPAPRVVACTGQLSRRRDLPPGMTGG